jgi:hypothetical protein
VPFFVLFQLNAEYLAALVATVFDDHCPAVALLMPRRVLVPKWLSQKLDSASLHRLNRHWNIAVTGE